MAKAKVKKVKVTQVKSSIGRLRNHKACLAGLGLRRIGHTVEVEDTPSYVPNAIYLLRRFYTHFLLIFLQ